MNEWLENNEARQKRLLKEVEKVFIKLRKDYIVDYSHAAHTLGMSLPVTTQDRDNISLAWLKKYNWVYKFIVKALLKAPTYFWERPSSTTGKYHPSDEFCVGGLVKHTIKCLRMAEELLRSVPEQYLSNVYIQANSACGPVVEVKESFIAAIVLHDLCSSGKPGQLYYREMNGEMSLSTDPLHPLYVRGFLGDIVVEDYLPKADQYPAHKSISFKFIMKLIEGHSGIWSPIPQVEPNDYWTQLVHQVDYIASRNFVNIDIDDDNGR